MNTMGMTMVKLKVSNLEESSGMVESEFLVDSGAHYTVVPYRMVRKLNLKPSYEQEFALADGKIMKRFLSSAKIEFEGKQLAVPVVLGQKGDSALLGVTTLESFGFMLDPFKRRIYPSRLMFA